jgi:aspartate/glutamate racemase
MKTIYVLGGMGPQATMDFETRVHQASQKLIPQRYGAGYPPMVVIYFRDAPILIGRDGNPIMPRLPNPALFEAAARLGPRWPTSWSSPPMVRIG